LNTLFVYSISNKTLICSEPLHFRGITAAGRLHSEQIVELNINLTQVVWKGEKPTNWDCSNYGECVLRVLAEPLNTIN
jgi:hypothetical protein